MHDPVDEVIASQAPQDARHVWILDRPALLEAARPWSPVHLWCDDLRDRGVVPDDMLANPWTTDLAPHHVWMGLPRSLDALDETLSVLHGLAARHGAEDLHVVAGARIRHMNRSANEVARRWFDEVWASRGLGKARALHFRGPRARPARGAGWPRRQRHDDLGIEVVAHGGVFHTAGLDAGTALLLDHLDEALADHEEGGGVVDLGCGNGIIAAAAARHGGGPVTATDVSWLAADSARLTARANGLEVEVLTGDGLTALADGSADLVLTNPPFHRGTAKESRPTYRMLADAARVLRPGGHLWCVFNSHLPWGEHLDATVGPTRQVARTRGYTLTCTTATHTTAPKGAPR